MNCKVGNVLGIAFYFVKRTVTGAPSQFLFFCLFFVLFSKGDHRIFFCGAAESLLPFQVCFVTDRGADPRTGERPTPEPVADRFIITGTDSKTG